MEGEDDIPVASAATVLLHLLGVHVWVSILGEEARQMLGGSGGAVSQALVVTVVGLGSAGHWRRRKLLVDMLAEGSELMTEMDLIDGRE